MDLEPKESGFGLWTQHCILCYATHAVWERIGDRPWGVKGWLK
jgi:hypothetical protein